MRHELTRTIRTRRHQILLRPNAANANGTKKARSGVEAAATMKQYLLKARRLARNRPMSSQPCSCLGESRPGSEARIPGHRSAFRLPQIRQMALKLPLSKVLRTG